MQTFRDVLQLFRFGIRTQPTMYVPSFCKIKNQIYRRQEDYTAPRLRFVQEHDNLGPHQDHESEMQQH